MKAENIGATLGAAMDRGTVRRRAARTANAGKNELCPPDVWIDQADCSYLLVAEIRASWPKKLQKKCGEWHRPILMLTTTRRIIACAAIRGRFVSVSS